MNKLLKATVFDKELSLTLIESTDMVNDAIKIHSLSPTAAAALGRTLTVCTFMSANLKSVGDKLSVTVAGNGPAGKITVCGNGKLQMRGSIDNPIVDLPLKTNGKLDVGGAVGKEGRLTVVRSMGLKDPYSGTAKLVSGEIAEDFASYYALSEQVPTGIALGVKIGTDGNCIGAGGVILQALPFAREENLIKAQEIIEKLSALSTIIEKEGIEGVIKRYFKGEEFESFYPEYKCLCSRDYIEGMLISLGKEEINDILEKEKEIRVSCQFCRTDYVFTREDADKMFK